MNTDKNLNELNSNIKEIFLKTKESLKSNIIRGQSRSISSDIEDELSMFISNVLSNKYIFYINSYIRIENKGYRPDLLIIDNNKVIAMLEIKANMGYCRDASDVMNKLNSYHEKFSKVKNIKLQLSSEEFKTVEFNKEVKKYLISFTSDNCSERSHLNNKVYAEKLDIEHYILFKGWYDNLEVNEIYSFINSLVNLDV